MTSYLHVTDPNNPSVSDAPIDSVTGLDEFYSFIGRCLKIWAKIDRDMYLIFTTILGCDEKHASIIYFKTPTFDGRLTLIDELIRTILPETENGGQKHPDLLKWMELIKEIRELAEIRNALAHDPVDIKLMAKISVDPDTSTTTSIRHVRHIIIRTSSDERNRGKRDRIILSEELPGKLDEFHAVGQKSWDFFVYFKRNYARPAPV